MKRVALVVPHMFATGGLPSVARFLTQAMDRTEEYRPVLYSVATSSRDKLSVRIAKPSSWFKGVRSREVEWEGRRAIEFGAYAVELECARYLPRKELTRQLNECELVQVLAGSPAWALVAARCSSPVALQVATLISEERSALNRDIAWSPVHIWRRMMTSVTAQLDTLGISVPDVIFVENRWMEKRLSQSTAVPVVFAPPGVDSALFRPGISSSSYQEGRYILSVGRFNDPRKQTETLFECYSILCDRMWDSPDLILAGPFGPTRMAWDRARELGIEGRIRFHKGLPTTELAELYRGTEVFVLASAEEGLGLVFLEAQASGVPVVATRTKGAETAVRDGVTGLLSPVGDPAALADSLARLLSDSDTRRKMGRAARKHVEENFSQEVSGKRFIREYDRLLG